MPRLCDFTEHHTSSCYKLARMGEMAVMYNKYLYQNNC